MHRYEKRLYYYITAAWLLYLVLRAICVPLINDEGFTFFQYIQAGLFMPGNALPDANNHLLNSLFALLSVNFFGISAFTLRIPNLIAALIFSKYLLNFSTLFNYRTLRWGFILSFLGSAYFSEFFAMCRGYGLSMAFLFGMLWYLYEFIESEKLRYFFFSLVFMLLGVAANLNLILTAMLFIGISSLYFFTHTELKRKNTDIYTFLLLCIAGGFILKYFIDYGFSLKEKGLLYIGAENGFFYGSIIPLVKVFFYGAQQRIILTIVGLFCIAILGSLIVLAVKRFKLLYAVAHLSLMFLVGNFCGILLMSKLFHVNSPQDRAILHLFPFLIFFLFFIADSRRSLLAKLLQPVYLLIPLYFLYITIPRINLKHSFFFSSQCFPPEFARYLHGKTNVSGYPAITSANAFMNPGYMFDNMNDGGKDANLYSQDYPAAYSDFQVVDTLLYPAWKAKLKLVIHDNNSGFSLLKRKDPLNCKYMGGKSGIYSNGFTKDKGIEFCILSADSLRGNPVYVGFDGILTAKSGPFRAALVVDVLDSTRNTHIFYEKLNLNEFHAEYNQTRFRNGILLPPLPGNAAYLKVYFWNEFLQEFILENAKCEVFSLRPNP